jgi:hypothetical protein
MRRDCTCFCFCAGGFCCWWLLRCRSFRPPQKRKPSTYHPTRNIPKKTKPQKPNNSKALEAYQTALSYAPNNKVASSRGEYCRARVERLGL